MHYPSPCLRPSIIIFIFAIFSSAVDSASDTIIQQACHATRFPQTCQSSLRNLPPSSTTPSRILTSAISASTLNLKTAKSMVQDILTSSSGNLNRTNAAKSCLEILTNSDRRISAAVSAALPNGRVKDGRAWMTAALAYQYDCWSGLKYVNDTSKVDKTMAFLAGLIEQTSNALSILVAYDVYGNDTASWMPPRTERDGFWEPVSGSSSSVPAFPAGKKADVTVCKTKGCDYTKIQDAVDAAPVDKSAKFVIWIKQGLYDEVVRVPFEKKNVALVGDGMGKTVITGNQNVGTPGVSTYNSATLGVLGDGFVMSGLTVQNTAGPDAHQAVAFRSDSDLSLIQNCEFIGNQDTLYAHSLRQLYKNCRIVGNVDFIFGNSASIFEDCTILVKPRQLKPEKGANNAVTAQGRTDPSQSTGFVFRNCVINGTDEYLKYYRANPKVHKNYLGRPWKEYSRTVFINCGMEGIVSADGWMPWSGDFALKTLFYGEYGNTGAGADLSSRVKWSSKIPEEHVGAYSAENFIQASELVVT